MPKRKYEVYVNGVGYIRTSCSSCGKKMLQAGARAGKCAPTCSKKCKYLYVAKCKTTSEMRNCDTCGKAIQVYQYELKDYRLHFCGLKCAHKGQHRLPKRRAPASDRFFQKVNVVEGGCWEWTGSRDGSKRSQANNGRGQYGKFALDGYKMIAAHRASYILHKGEIPDGMQVCHTCDYPPCVNPDHLFLGTREDNVGDSVKKGRQWFQNPRYKHPLLGKGKRGLQKRSCVVCGKATLQRWDAFVNGARAVCSKECKGINASLVQKTRRIVDCSWCGKKIERASHELKKRDTFFCGRHCFGKYIAEKRWYPEGRPKFRL